MKLLASTALAALLACAPAAHAQFASRSSRVDRVTVGPRVSLFRYRRALQLAPGAKPGDRSCAILDGQIYAHAELGLRDLRIDSPSLTGPVEDPYALTTSDIAAPQSDAARVLNLGVSGGHLSFDLAMPARAYTGVVLDLAGRDFVGTATVTGRSSFAAGARSVQLGRYTVFDLSRQGLSRATALPIPESTFPYLHIDLTAQGAAGQAFALSPEMVHGAQVPPDREAQTLYTTVAESQAITQRERAGKRETVVTFNLPARVPVEEVQFVLAPDATTNFSRAIRITASPSQPRTGERDGDDPAPDETLTGTIARIHLDEQGHAIQVDDLSVPATIGINLQSDARVEVAIEDGDDLPVPLKAVRLQMRQRKLCFDAPAGAPSLYYGAHDLAPVLYDYSRLFSPSAPALAATLGPEQLNPGYRPPPPVERPYSERHPELLWLALLAVVAVLGTVAFRSAQRL